jgi:hypothetical protein
MLNRNRWIPALLLGAAAVLAVIGMPAPALAQDAGPHEIKIHSIPDFLKLPANMYLGEAAGVAVNSAGHVFVFTRGNSTGPAYAATAAELLEFDPSGNYIREIGHNLYAWSFAHAVRVDRHDNIWVTDKGSDMVIEFNPAGRVKMVIGRKQEASDDGTGPIKHVNPPRPPVDGQFRQVTDVTWDTDDNAYISDGYINSRVAKVDKNGDWVKSFGEPGSGQGQLNTPHSIAIDAQNNIYVANRGNRRIEVFDRDGNYERQITINVPPPPGVKAALGATPVQAADGSWPNATMAPGAPWAICITPGTSNQVLFAADAFPGRIYKLSLDGKVLGYWGRSGKQLGQFGWIHELACPNPNTVFAAELLNWRVQKMILDDSMPAKPAMKGMTKQ